jgi:sec-independent protein translocase protein TatA
MGMSFSHMALLLAIVLIVFGAGKLPRVMGDIAKGLKAFKDGMKDGEDADKVAKIPDDKNRAA